MKILKGLLTFFFLLSTTIYGQEVMESKEGILDFGNIESGGYGAPLAKMTRVNERDAVLSGAKGAWIINHNFALGGAAYALVNNVNFATYSDSLEFGYGGVTLDYIFKPMDKVALSAGILLGGGYLDFNDNTLGSDGIYTAEPEVSAQYEVTKNFRAAITAGYRAVSDVDLPGLSNDKLSGFTYGLAFNFGSF